MLSFLLILVLVASIIMLIFAVCNYRRDKEEQQKFMNTWFEQYQRQQEYTEMYNECKKMQEKLKVQQYKEERED